MLVLSRKKIIYKEAGHDFTSDICPSATLQDLDLDAVNDFRRRWFNKSGNKSKDMILEHIKSRGVNGIRLSELLRLLPRHSKDQIQNLLRELKKEEKIVSDGRANKARWYLV